MSHGNGLNLQDPHTQLGATMKPASVADVGSDQLPTHNAFSQQQASSNEAYVSGENRDPETAPIEEQMISSETSITVQERDAPPLSNSAAPTGESQPSHQDAPATPPYAVQDDQPGRPIRDSDSTLGDETASLTETITSLNYQYRYDNGRRFHAFSNSAYLLPNDEREQDRLEGQHRAWLMAMGGRLHLAPLKDDIQNVLDVATGTGNWAIDFADEYPSARVRGTDLSPIQPNLSVPPNCSFVIEDSEDDWIWDEKFDFIHSRTLASTWRDWPGYFRKCFEFLKPGGYVELHEFTFPFHCDDDTASPTGPMILWSAYFAEAAAKGGVNIDLCAHLEPLLHEAGFVDIVKLRLRMPFTGWSEDANERLYGAYYGKIFDWGVSLALFMHRLGWSRERAELFLMEVRKEAADVGVHAYIPLYVYTAKKPENHSTTMAS